MPQNDLLNIMGTPENKPSTDLISLLGEPAKKKVSTLVSTPDEEFKTTDAIASEAEFDPRVADSLSFQAEDKKQPVNYMGLFDKKDDFQIADESGVSLSFMEEANKASQNAERPLEFLVDANDIKKRLDAIPKYFPELSEQANQLKSQLVSVDSQNIDDIKSQLEQLESSTVGQASMTGLYGGVGGDWVEYNEDVLKDGNRLATKQLLEDNEKLRKSVSGNLASGTSEGIKDYADGYLKLTSDLRGNQAVTDLMAKFDRVEEGDDVQFTSDDKILIKALVDNAQLHGELDGKIPSSYKMGEAVGTSLGFMAEFVLTGGITTAVGKTVLKSVAKKGLKEVGVTAAKMGAAKKLGVGAVVKLAQAGVQTAAMPSFYKKTAENVSNGMNFGEATLDAYWETGAEVLSERVFMKNPVSGGVGNSTNSIMRRMGINMDVDKGMVGVVKNTFEEAAEEKIGEIMTAPKDYESFGEFWKGFTDKEQNKIMLGSVGLMTGVMGSVAVSGSTLSETRRKVRIKRAEKFVPSDLRAEIDIVLDNKDLSVSQQYDLIVDAIGDRVESQELGEDPATTAENAMRYAQYRVQEKTAETTDENAVMKDGDMTVGGVEEVGTMQEQFDYLKEKGIDANGLNAEQVEKLYTKTKSEEDKAAIEKVAPDDSTNKGVSDARTTSKETKPTEEDSNEKLEEYKAALQEKHKKELLDIEAEETEVAEPFVPVKKLKGKKVRMEVEVLETGAKTKVDMDALKVHKDIKRRDSIYRKLKDCLG